MPSQARKALVTYLVVDSFSSFELGWGILYCPLSKDSTRNVGSTGNWSNSSRRRSICSVSLMGALSHTVNQVMIASFRLSEAIVFTGKASLVQVTLAQCIPSTVSSRGASGLRNAVHVSDEDSCAGRLGV